MGPRLRGDDEKRTPSLHYSPEHFFPMRGALLRGVPSFQQLALDQQDGTPEVVHALLEALDSRRD
jgi:hypothetical protein